MSDKIARLVANNAAWIQMATSALGIGGEFTPVLWQNVHDMPPIFPNADVLGGSIEEQLSAIQALVEARAGRVVAVKDAWAQLDLTKLGFEMLFEAQWLYREAKPLSSLSGELEIERVTTPEGLREFALACNGEDIPTDVYSPELLKNSDIVWLLGKKEGQIVAGVTAVYAAGVNGINNLFGETDSDKTQLLIAAMNAFPEVAACGYEGDKRVAPYLPLGFEPAGHLRVWLHLP